MTHPLRASAAPGGHAPADGSYEPGVCNIGPSEIAARRRVGHVGLVVTLVTLAVLILLGVPALVRFVVALPAAGTAITYLQAVLRFCVAFGSRGTFNFGELGQLHHVTDTEARARDRARALQMTVGGVAIGVIVGVVAVLLPL